MVSPEEIARAHSLPRPGVVTVNGSPFEPSGVFSNGNAGQHASTSGEVSRGELERAMRGENAVPGEVADEKTEQRLILEALAMQERQLRREQRKAENRAEKKAQGNRQRGRRRR